MTRTEELYDELLGELKRIALLSSCASVLSWDEQTHLPPGGAEHRANQLSLLAGMIHQQSTAPRIGELLSALAEPSLPGDEDSPRHVNVRESKRVFERAIKIPQRLVEELSRVCTLAQQAWVEARKNADFKAFLPWLTQVIALKREEADAVGYGDGVPYDALLDQYEPGAKTSDIEAIFVPLRNELVKLVAAIASSSRRPERSILSQSFPCDAQRDFGMEAARRIGFNFDEGRMDVAAHPFCSGLGPGDCRLTTRYDEHNFPCAFFGTLHEAGHGIYEQGLDKSAFGTPMGDAASLGIHESQSRLWENFVGRSRPFWSFFFPCAQRAFPAALSGIALDDFYFALNDVRPTFIRTESDEVTYNLHIMLRFELEQALISGSLHPADVPGAWNDTFARFFGITPANDSDGCLQDIHWSGGLVGYFPTYALGNMYAAQFFSAAQKALGDFDAKCGRGQFAPLKNWLNQNIHRRGKQYPARRLVEVVTGSPLSHRPLLSHLNTKFSALYGL